MEPRSSSEEIVYTDDMAKANSDENKSDESMLAECNDDETLTQSVSVPSHVSPEPSSGFPFLLPLEFASLLVKMFSDMADVKEAMETTLSNNAFGGWIWSEIQDSFVDQFCSSTRRDRVDNLIEASERYMEPLKAYAIRLQKILDEVPDYAAPIQPSQPYGFAYQQAAPIQPATMRCNPCGQTGHYPGEHAKLFHFCGQPGHTVVKCLSKPAIQA
ncbi:hypothetical protein DYB37_011733 [Aphanomyces astaci]|uniref:Uncharacterized protein n=1 Tax=Aphanomyces astaci TaxID=112090 RepID=A0A397F821_APHAT|nr:hypothetical protein DYB35_011425 [Aphanomyces astaci]RHZ16965.1 hypothetical protein DYB37_011733 [Aphanomyces astaci]RHZ19738.1 hypothetical protein DYB31_008924 [Aphanomyces astaci]